MPSNKYYPYDKLIYSDWIKKNKSFLNTYLKEGLDDFRFVHHSRHFIDQFYFWLFKVKNRALDEASKPWEMFFIPDKCFSKWGQKNTKIIFERLENWWYENYEDKYEYLNKFYNTEDNTPFEIDYYENEYLTDFHTRSFAFSGLYVPYDVFMNCTVKGDMRKVLRECENDCREKNGIPKIGEGWVSETALFYFVKTSLPEYLVEQHSSPYFLGRQHYDIFLPELKIAIEYQGVQHSKPIEYFGGNEAFLKNKERDKRKKKISKNNGVILIEVFPEYSESKFLTKLKSLVTRRNNEDKK